MIAGNIYGVVLNDAAEQKRLGVTLREKPYGAPPVAPVIYQRPLTSIARGPVKVPEGGLVAATTVALLVARNACRVQSAEAGACIGAASLAVDLFVPTSSYYRPAIANRNSDGYLVLGDFAELAMPKAITLSLDGELVHEWSTDRLIRSATRLIADLSQYMTLWAGDVLLIGLPGDAPVITAGQTISVFGRPLPQINTATTGEAP
ncbi:fumarylacetoacetate hydrolase family protein [Novosphingobium sp. MMS21-SN21R]|uniref:fumarylacetoacetate hydrolase family protein n=1 Tax=Novosphingobium sp. MMS21-SN21R TaxID=2969298 RepID=UPI0028851467|nr:fumarylacetoacetate hydrolase family protein [Novosphingobium sp. MMS21-SN21R]MDT0510224.1 fumarylacetoacetate hydrolase family protein [Novosphingobium sp. MMS21-SN21R]